MSISNIIGYCPDDKPEEQRWEDELESLCEDFYGDWFNENCENDIGMFIREKMKEMSDAMIGEEETLFEDLQDELSFDESNSDLISIGHNLKRDEIINVSKKYV